MERGQRAPLSSPRQGPLMRRPSYVKQRLRLDSKVKFQRRGDGRNELNEPTPDAWADLFETRCAVYPAPGYERFANQQTTATAPILIEVRSEARTRDLRASDRAIVTPPDGGPAITYNIVSPREQAERGDNIRITAAADKGV